jgi:glyoxylase-like metal-dependent hydrolase (beta-lactamase superfamily II)
VLGWLILGSEKPILVDTGFRSAEDLSQIVPARQSDEQTLEAQLAKHDLKTGDVGYVIHTHLHVDHAGLTYKLANAELFAQKRELEFAAEPLFPAAFYDQTDIERLNSDLKPRLTLLDGDTELFPGIRTIVTEGHTPAHQMVFVELDSGTAAVCGDAAYNYEFNVEKQVPPGYYYNLQAVSDELKLLKEQTYVLPTHDGAVYDRYAGGIS